MKPGSLEIPAMKAKPQRKESTLINDLVSLRSKAIKMRQQADDKIKGYDAALLALGWTDQLSLTAE